MKKVLFISFFREQGFYGGLQCSQRNIQILKNLFGEENVVQYYIYQKFDSLAQRYWRKIVALLTGKEPYLSKKVVSDVMILIKQQSISDVFFDISIIGMLAKVIKQQFPQTRVYTFFHNVEFIYNKGFVKESLLRMQFQYIHCIPTSWRNERLACRFSDKVIVLTDVDAKALEKMYHRKADAIVPISFDDTFEETYIDNSVPQKPYKALFVGSYFFGNTQGLMWFCKNILPNVDITLDIVGANMDRFANDIPSSSKVHIYNSVPDLTPFFNNADFVVLPITSGSGMKVKTAESLMYGKYLIGTDMAFDGYDISTSQGIRCNTSDEFISAINNLNLQSKFCEASRELFKRQYTTASVVQTFKHLFQ